MKKIVFWLITILCFITFFLLCLKIGFYINIEWWVVFAPLWVPVSIFLLIMMIIIIPVLISSLNRKVKQKEEEDIVLKNYKNRLPIGRKSKTKKLRYRDKWEI